jgi:hypothetical protein
MKQDGDKKSPSRLGDELCVYQETVEGKPSVRLLGRESRISSTEGVLTLVATRGRDLEIL